MLRELVQLLPSDPNSATAAVATLGAIGGGFLWVAGARYSRPIMALVAVALGGAIGSALPSWFGWSISAMGPAVGLAVILGTTGFVLHRVWVGIGLGAILAVWAALASYIVLHGTATMQWPDIAQHHSVASWLRAAWQNVPGTAAKVIPWAAAASMVGGLAMTIIWPRFSTWLAWSLIGVSLLVGMGSAAVNYTNPALIKSVPPQSWAQCAALAALIGIGMLGQWGTTPATAGAAQGKKSTKSNSKSEEKE